MATGSFRPTNDFGGLTSDDPLGLRMSEDPRERAHAEWRRLGEIADKLATQAQPDLGKAAPWLDHNFQRVIVERLKREREFRRSHEKLAVIKEVFGGK